MLYSAEGTVQCNGHNFVMQGVYSCGLNWWQSKDLSQYTADSNMTATDIVEDVLQYFGMNLSDVNAALYNLPLTTSLDKLVETVALVEPYTVYMAADVFQGFNLTAADLQKLGLPSSWTNRQKLIDLYQYYYSKNCEM